MGYMSCTEILPYFSRFLAFGGQEEMIRNKQIFLTSTSAISILKPQKLPNKLEFNCINFHIKLIKLWWR